MTCSGPLLLRRRVVLTEPEFAHVPALRQGFIDHVGIRARALPEEPGGFAMGQETSTRFVVADRFGEQVPAGLEVAALSERFTTLALRSIVVCGTPSAGSSRGPVTVEA